MKRGGEQGLLKWGDAWDEEQAYWRFSCTSRIRARNDFTTSLTQPVSCWKGSSQVAWSVREGNTSATGMVAVSSCSERGSYSLKNGDTSASLASVPEL